MRYIYTMEYYHSAIKKNKIMPFAATWMDLEISILSEVSQKEKYKYHMISLIMSMTSPHCVPTDRRSTSPCGGAGLMVLRRPRRIDWVDGPPCP